MSEAAALAAKKDAEQKKGHLLELLPQCNFVFEDALGKLKESPEERKSEMLERKKRDEAVSGNLI